MASIRPTPSRITCLSLTLCCLLLASCSRAQSSRHLQRGQEDLARGDLSGAQLEFRTAVELAPYSAVARYMSGRVAELLGDFHSARESYLYAIDTAPDFLPAYVSLARLYIEDAAPSRAIELIAPALQQHPDDANLLAVRGVARLQLQDRAGALADAERAIKLAPDNENAVALRTSLYQLSGQTPTAIALVNAALMRAPTSTNLRALLASLYLAVNRPDLAAEQLRTLVKLQPRNPGYRYRLSQVYVQAGRLDDAQAVLLGAIAAQPDNDSPKLAYVDFLFQRRSPVEAERALDEFTSQRPSDHALQLERAELQQRQGHLTDALRSFLALAATARGAPQALTAMTSAAAILASQGRLDEASQLIQSVLHTHPQDDDALNLRAALELARYDPAAAIADLRTVLADRPRSAAVLRMLGRAQLANGDAAAAERDLRAAIGAAPDDVSTQLELAQLLMQTRRSDAAVALLEQTLRTAPADQAVRVALIHAYLANSDPEAARKGVAKLQTLAPQAQIVAYLSGLVAQAQKHGVEAEHDFASALRLDPAAADARAAWAKLQVIQGHTARAIDALRAYLASHPTDTRACNLLAELYAAEKDNPRAVAQWRRAIQLSPQWWLPYYNLAALQTSSGNAPAALATLEQGVSAVGPEPTLIEALAAGYESQGRADAAIELYQGLYRRTPGSALVANNLALLLVTYRKDRDSLQQASELTARFAVSSDAQLLDTAGWVQLQLGDVTRARIELQQAAALAPASNLLHYHLGMAELAAGHRERARAELNAALENGKPFVGVAQARAALTAIGVDEHRR